MNGRVMTLGEVSALAEAIRAEVGKAVVGQHETVDALLKSGETTRFVLSALTFVARRGWRNEMPGADLPTLSAPAAGFAAKVLCGIKRYMGESMRKVQKERRVFGILKELESKVAVLLGQSGLVQSVDIRIDDLIAANQGEFGESFRFDHRSVGPHIVRVRQP